MRATVVTHDSLVEVTFHAIPEAEDFVALREQILKLAPSYPQGLAVLATITEGGLGTLSPPARKALVDRWQAVRPRLAAIAVIVEGTGVAAMLTRGFVRMLGTTLGRAWTVHETRELAVRHLAAVLRLPPDTWVSAAS